LVIADKPAGMTSHDVVARVRRIFGTRKVGHAGTLDPMATGVLVLGLERATKLLGHLALERKVYLATIRLGASTTTDDAEGVVLSEVDGSGVAESAVLDGVAALTGAIDQVPSAVSAVKVAGKRAYQRVREGETVELPARPVVVYRFDVLAFRREPAATELDVLVDCSSGTYVRALARDLGAGLGVGGHLTALRRTQVGPFGLRVARTLDQLAESPELSLDLDASVAMAFPRRDVSGREALTVAHGGRLSAGGLAGTYGVFDPDGHVIALARDEGRGANPLVVLAPAG
jgi:tRNA pseudouridine55 synthase